MSARVDAHGRGRGGLEVLEWVLLRLRGRLGRDLATRARLTVQHPFAFLQDDTARRREFLAPRPQERSRNRQAPGRSTGGGEGGEGTRARQDRPTHLVRGPLRPKLESVRMPIDTEWTMCGRFHRSDPVESKGRREYQEGEGRGNGGRSNLVSKPCSLRTHGRAQSVQHKTRPLPSHPLSFDRRARAGRTFIMRVSQRSVRDGDRVGVWMGKQVTGKMG